MDLRLQRILQISIKSQITSTYECSCCSESIVLLVGRKLLISYPGDLDKCEENIRDPHYIGQGQ